MSLTPKELAMAAMGSTGGGFDWGSAAQPDAAPEASGFDWATAGEADGPAEARLEDPGFLSSVGHKLLSGFTKKHSDELVGKIVQAKVNPDAGGSVQWRDPSTKSGSRALRTKEDVYAAGRNSERGTLAGAEEHHPTASFLAEMGGDFASDFLGAGTVGKTVGALGPLYQMASGALSGEGGSESESKGGVALDSGLSAAASYLLPKAGGAVLKKALGSGFGARAADYVGQKVKGATAEIAERAGKKLQKASGEAWGPFGQKLAEINRRLEIIDRRFPGASDGDIAAALGKEGVAISAEAITGLRDQLFKGNAEAIGKSAGELATKKEGWDAFKGGAAELGEQLTKQEGSVLRQAVPWMKRYAPPVIGSMLGGPAGAAAGMALGGGMESAVGALGGAGMRPALQATLRRLAHPAVRKAGWQAVGAAASGAESLPQLLEKYGPALTRELLGQKALADALRDEEKP